MSKKKNAGFTLIELMIVVAIIAIIAAIAIPNLLRSRMAANESSAIGSMRTISTGEASFQAAGFEVIEASGVARYGTLAELENPPGDAPGFIDEVLGSGGKQGYLFTVTLGDEGGFPTYTCIAEPQMAGRSGVRTFFVDESGVIRHQPDGTAPSVESDPLT